MFEASSETASVHFVPLPTRGAKWNKNLYGTRGFLPLLDFLSLPPFPPLKVPQLAVRETETIG